MKFKFSNGNSINIWDSEYVKIVLSKGIITCTRPDGKIATIEIPEEWVVGVRLNSNAQSPRDGPGKGSSEKLHETGERAHCLAIKPTSVGACYDTKEKYCCSKEFEAKYGQLTNQIQTLRQDLIRFNAETKGQIEPLLELPAKLDRTNEESSDHVEKLNQSYNDRFDVVDERLDWLEGECNRGNEVQPWMKQERYQSDGQKWKKKKHK